MKMKKKKKLLKKDERRNQRMKKERMKKQLNEKKHLLNPFIGFGCDEVKKEELPSYVNKVISKMGLPRPIKVPERKRGLTSSGEELRCHKNVTTLVEVHNGKRLVGYMMEIDTYSVQLRNHSVWITPENNIVDVTKKTKSQKKGKPNNELDYQYFIPISEISDSDVDLKDLIIPKYYKRSGYVSGFYDENIENNNLVIKKWDNPSFPKDLMENHWMLFENDLVEDGSYSIKEIEDMKQRRIDGMESTFSLPSLFTGKKLSVDKTSLKTPLFYTSITL
jgi:hypothetical protein